MNAWLLTVRIPRIYPWEYVNVTEVSVNSWGELGHDILIALANATAYALVSFLTSVLTGLPEVDTVSLDEPKDEQRDAESTTDETEK